MLSRLITQTSHKGLRSRNVVRATSLSRFSTTTTRNEGGGGADPLKADQRTQKPQEEAHATDESTKDSIRHAAEGNVTGSEGHWGDGQECCYWSSPECKADDGQHWEEDYWEKWCS